MKTPFPLIALLAGTLCAAEPARNWTNSEGKSLSATFVEAVRGADGQPTGVKLRLRNGQQVEIELAKLSEADREYVATAAQAASESAQKEKLDGRRAKWGDDWEKARSESEATGLPILLFMTGSDWCGYCMRLKENVFEKREFERFADGNLVLMEADFPRSKTLPKSTAEQNEKLKSEFPAGGYPTVYLIKDGKVLDKFVGYGGDPAEDYIGKIKAKLTGS
jgi:thiol-disulfide isomerase/thioredoxin